MNSLMSFSFLAANLSFEYSGETVVKACDIFFARIFTADWAGEPFDRHTLILNLLTDQLIPHAAYMS